MVGEEGMNRYMAMVKERMKSSHRFYVRTSDKITVRPFVHQRIGEGYLSSILGMRHGPAVGLYLHGEYVAKPNNASKRLIFACDHLPAIDQCEVADQLELWRLGKPFDDGRNRHYANITPGWIVEKFYRRCGAGAPLFHVYVFLGTAKLIQRFTYGLPQRNTPEPVLYADHWFPDGTPVKVWWGKRKPAISDAPPEFAEVIQVAEALGDGIDHCRIDFLSTDEGIIFSEMSYCPAAGRARIEPKEIVNLLADEWRSAWQNQPSLY